jgi:hypothetical protein
LFSCERPKDEKGENRAEKALFSQAGGLIKQK